MVEISWDLVWYHILFFFLFSFKYQHLFYIHYVQLLKSPPPLLPHTGSSYSPDHHPLAWHQRSVGGDADPHGKLENGRVQKWSNTLTNFPNFPQLFILETFPKPSIQIQPPYFTWHLHSHIPVKNVLYKYHCKFNHSWSIERKQPKMSMSSIELFFLTT